MHASHPHLMAVLALDRAARPELALDRGSVREYDEKSGHLHVAVSPISKATVRPYYGREIPRSRELGLAQDRIYNLYLDPDELAKGAATFTGKPLLIQHRPQLATDHDRTKVIGAVGECEWAAPYAQSALTIWDGDGIQAVESGKMQELSAGFFYDADMQPGSVNGQAYDGVMRNIQGNHVAIVEAGRAGPDVMVLDEKPKEQPPMTKPLSRKAAALRSVLLDYLPPKLATDAALDIRALVAPVTADNWATERPRIAAAIRGAKLAQDAKMDDLETALDAADDDEDEKKKVAEDEDDDEAKEKAEAKREAAMDAAIKAAAKTAASEARAEMIAIRDAERAVQPFVGEIAVAMDSAAAVYEFCFKQIGQDVTGVHASAYPAILAAHAKAATARPAIAQDAAAPKDFDTRWGRGATAPRLRAV